MRVTAPKRACCYTHTSGRFAPFHADVIAANAGEAPPRPGEERGGGRPSKMAVAQLRLTRAGMGQPETEVGELRAILRVARQTLYRHVNPRGELRDDGPKLLGRKGRGTEIAADNTFQQAGDHAHRSGQPSSATDSSRDEGERRR